VHLSNLTPTGPSASPSIPKERTRGILQEVSITGPLGHPYRVFCQVQIEVKSAPSKPPVPPFAHHLCPKTPHLFFPPSFHCPLSLFLLPSSPVLCRRNGLKIGHLLAEQCKDVSARRLSDTLRRTPSDSKRCKTCDSPSRSRLGISFPVMRQTKRFDALATLLNDAHTAPPPRCCIAACRRSAKRFCYTAKPPVFMLLEEVLNENGEEQQMGRLDTP